MKIPKIKEDESMAESNDGMGNMKPVKREPNGKVDNIQMLLSAVILYDASQTQINK